MNGMPIRARLFLALVLGLALLAGTVSAGCSDRKDCRPYVDEVVGAARRSKSDSPQAFAQKLRDHVRAVGWKYRDRLKQCRPKATHALQEHLISRCVSDARVQHPRGCPSGWDKKRCCQLNVFCVLRHPTAADYCDWEPEARPPPALPRCTNCPGCVPESTTPPPKRNIHMWLGGDGDTLAVVLDQPVNDVWLLPVHAPPAHLEPMLYALWKQPDYLAPNVAIVQGEIVSVDAWNTLEQALHQGGWTQLGLNLVQWHGRLHCPPTPPAKRYTFGPGRRTVTVAITDGVVWINGKQLLVLEKGRVAPEAKGRDAGGFIIVPLQKRLGAMQRPGDRVNVLRVAIRRGLTVPARLVAEIIFTSMQTLKGAHARITCSDVGLVK